MKKLMFVLMMVSLLLAACGGGAKPAETGPVEITFTMWGAPEELAVWQAVVEDFHKANPNITVKVDVSDWDSYWTKLNTLIAGGTPPDVFAMDAPLFLDWQSRGALLNLQPYIDKAPGFLDGFYPQTLTAYKTADGYYGLPRDFQTIVLFYNKDMFDAAKVAYPTADWTYNDLLLVASVIAAFARSVEITGLPQAVVAGPEGDVRLWESRRGVVDRRYEVRYRIHLDQGTLPGIYPWPVLLRLEVV